jgi:predicted GTPase
VLFRSKDLQETINATKCDVVVSGTPIDLTRVLRTSIPIVRIRYGVGEKTARDRETVLGRFLKERKLL